MGEPQDTNPLPEPLRYPAKAMAISGTFLAGSCLFWLSLRFFSLLAVYQNPPRIPGVGPRTVDVMTHFFSPLALMDYGRGLTAILGALAIYWCGQRAIKHHQIKALWFGALLCFVVPITWWLIQVARDGWDQFIVAQMGLFLTPIGALLGLPPVLASIGVGGWVVFTTFRPEVAAALRAERESS